MDGNLAFDLDGFHTFDFYRVGPLQSLGAVVRNVDLAFACGVAGVVLAHGFLRSASCGVGEVGPGCYVERAQAV